MWLLLREVLCLIGEAPIGLCGLLFCWLLLLKNGKSVESVSQKSHHADDGRSCSSAVCTQFGGSRTWLARAQAEAPKESVFWWGGGSKLGKTACVA